MMLPRDLLYAGIKKVAEDNGLTIVPKGTYGASALSSSALFERVYQWIDIPRSEGTCGASALSSSALFERVYQWIDIPRSEVRVIFKYEFFSTKCFSIRRDVPITCKLVTSVSDLKSQLCKEELIPLEAIKELRFEDEELEENKTLRSYNMQDDASINIIQAQLFEIIYVKGLEGPDFPITANLYGTALELKKMYSEKQNIGIDAIQFNYEGRELKDDRILCYYGISTKTTIEVIVEPLYERLFILRANQPIIIVTANLYGTVKELKQIYCEKDGIHPEAVQFIHKGKQLEDDCILSFYGISCDDTLQVTLFLKGGGQLFYIDMDEYNSDYDYDFTKVNDYSSTFSRGGISYTRPVGSYRYAINIKKYGDKKWLGCVNGAGEWAVAYHGTKANNILPIVQNGFQLAKCERFRYGKGIYCTPDPKTAIGYATEFKHKTSFFSFEKSYKVVLQTRVDPYTMEKIEKADDQKYDGDYWLIPNDRDIRPYGVCIFPV
uniref:Ubiquitin-like domain-containing protein n=1 Tax=Panagrolaimus sp. ES5 TaxID=591445 RepID=A0AC34GVC1_9BILA